MFASGSAGVRRLCCRMRHADFPQPPSRGRPRIGVPVRLSSSSNPDPRVAKANALFEHIVELLREGGGEPVPLTAAGPDDAGLAAALESLDGVVLPGGGDVDPVRYGEPPSAVCYDVNDAQDELDTAVATFAIDAGLPVLGICRGHQLLNVLYGGTLDPGHGAGDGSAPQAGTGGRHGFVGLARGGGTGRLQGGSPLRQRMPVPRHVKIASGHHQAVARVAEGLQVSAVAEDGTVEALEDPERWVASVQWHPEALELPAGERLAPFRAFVEVCRNRP